VLQALSELKLPGDRALEFIVPVAGRRHEDLSDLLAPLREKLHGAQVEVTEALRWMDHRLAVAHNPTQGV
jgi:hypothetical protein